MQLNFDGNRIAFMNVHERYLSRVTFTRTFFFVDATQTFGFCKAIKYTSNGNDLEKILTTDCI